MKHIPPTQEEIGHAVQILAAAVGRHLEQDTIVSIEINKDHEITVESYVSKIGLRPVFNDDGYYKTTRETSRVRYTLPETNPYFVEEQ